MIQVKGIARRNNKRAIMEELPECEIGKAFGVEGDFRGKPGKRQITILSEASWENACEEAGADLPWTARRANLLVAGIQFDDTFVGKILQIGALQLEITKETVPCYRMDEAHEGLQEAMKTHWRGGVCCRVLQSGIIGVGDIVEISG